MWSGSPVDYSGIRIFGCPAYAYVNDGKLEPHAKKCVFLGYTNGIKGFRLWDPSTSRIITSRDVILNESVFLHVKSSKKATSERVENENGEEIQGEVIDDVLDDDVDMQTPQEGGDVPSTSSSRKATTLRKETSPMVQTTSIVQRRPRRQIKAPSRLGHEDDDLSLARKKVKCPVEVPKKLEFEEMVAYALLVASDVIDLEPSSYEEVKECKDVRKWLGAMKKEIHSFLKNQTWELVERPKGKKIVDYKWIYKYKEGILGVKEARCKASLVARGFSQVPGIEYNEIFSPVVRHTSIHTLLALVALNDYELAQLDIKTIFLHGELEEEIYMRQPDGHVVEGKEDRVCLLKKSLYGLKQSPKQ